MTAATIGRIEDDGDLDAFLATFEQVFGLTGTDAGRARWKRVLERERLVVARAGDRIVATSGSYTFETTLPGGDTVGCAGVTLVSVRADHRRRGVLRAMMAELLDDARDRGEPLAALWASENPIYGRYGFGPAVPTIHLDVERAQARFRVPAPVDEVELVDADEAGRRFPAIHEAARAQRPVLFARTDGWWGRELEDPPDRREGAGEKRFAVLADRAYAIHRLRGSWSDAGVPTGTVEVQDLVALDPQAWASMWRFVVDTDLSSRTVAGRRPVDDPLLHLLDDPARAKPQADWALQVRLVDVPTALASRGYLADGDLTLAVHDDLLRSNDGRWRLVADGGRATCEPTSDPAQLEMDVETLATVVLGGVRVSSLVTAGRIVAADPGAVPRADLLFASSPAPWHGGMF
jgi:predicted acetyltransferase